MKRNLSLREFINFTYIVYWIQFHIILIHCYYIFYFNYSVRQEAYIKSVLVNTKYKQNIKHTPTYKDMEDKSNTTSRKIPFLAVPYNVGTTSHFNPRHAQILKHSFGCPRYFFRLDLTSAITSVPYVYMDWCNFRAKEYSRTCFQGDLTEEEWLSGPKTNVANTCPFITLDDIIPSRFALAYNRFYNVAFLSLDPEQIIKTMECGKFNDFGDDLFGNKESMNKFFNMKL